MFGVTFRIDGHDVPVHVWSLSRSEVVVEPDVKYVRRRYYPEEGGIGGPGVEICQKAIRRAHETLVAKLGKEKVSHEWGLWCQRLVVDHKSSPTILAMLTGEM